MKADADERDFRWGGALGGLLLGVWHSPSPAQAGSPVHVRVAARNCAERDIEVGRDVRLVVEHADAVREQRGGPHWSAPARVAAGETLELREWRIGEESGLGPGVNRVWVVYHAPDTSEVRSATVEIEWRTADA